LIFIEIIYIFLIKHLAGLTFGGSVESD